MTKRDDNLIRVTRSGRRQVADGKTIELRASDLPRTARIATERVVGKRSRPTLRVGQQRRARSSNGGALFLAFAVVVVIALAALASRWNGSDTATAPAPIEAPAAPLATWVPPTPTVPPMPATLMPTLDIPCGKDFIIVGQTHCPPEPFGIQPEYEYKPDNP